MFILEGLRMISSMTGFGRGEAKQDGHRATMELTSINSRYLELQVRLPRELAALEPRVKEILSDSFSRGKLMCVLAWEPASGATIKVALNEPVARMYQDVFRQIQECLGVSGEVTVRDMVTLPDVFTVSSQGFDAQLAGAVAEEALGQAVAALREMRHAEGQKIHHDLAGRLSVIVDALGCVETAAQGNVDVYRQKLQARARELFGESGYDPQRLAEEVAYLAERSDITEECVRLRIHAQHFRDTLEGSGGAGRRLNFLIQELNREANTIGSKAQSAEISTWVVTIKEELEKIREQIQNVE